MQDTPWYLRGGVGGPAVKVGIYDDDWMAAGGAQRWGGAVARILRSEGQVELLTPGELDRDRLSGRLGLDLGHVAVRPVGRRPGALTAASARYDLFVNVAAGCVERAATRRSVYLVTAPDVLDAQLAGLGRPAGRGLGRLRSRWSPARLEWAGGFDALAPARGSGAGRHEGAALRLTTRPGRPVALTLVLGCPRSARSARTPVRVEVDGRVVAEAEVAPSSWALLPRRAVPVRVELASPAPGIPVEVRLISGAVALAGGDDLHGGDRQEGVPLRALRAAGGGLRNLRRRWPLALAPPVSQGWLDSYGAVVADCEPTRAWVERHWRTGSTVLHPPVAVHQPTPKEPMVLSVGHFAAGGPGATAAQLDLVRAFRRLCDGELAGWKLHLAGSCDEPGSAALAELRGAADGYPVELHVDPGGDELADLYARASIYWQPGRLGEEGDPVGLEPFRPATVEAMSAGAVPVVPGWSGAADAVRHGVDGYHVRTDDGLRAMTGMLVRDAALREAMAAAATARAREFSREAFEGRLRSLLGQLR